MSQDASSADGMRDLQMPFLGGFSILAGGSNHQPICINIFEYLATAIGIHWG
jgi:hypothetical protein